MPDLKLSSPLQYVKGVGPKKAQALAKIGLETVEDLLGYYPRLYLDRSTITPISSLQVHQTGTIVGTVKAHGILHGRRRRYEVILQDDTGAIPLVWFGGLRYWERLFKKGQTFAATGTVGYFMGLQIVHPEMERLDDDSDSMVHAGRIIPVYPQTSDLNKMGLTSRGIRTLTTFIFAHLDDRIPDRVPAEERDRYSLPSMNEAVREIHYPQSRDAIETARRRLSFEELLGLQYFVFRNKHRKVSVVKAHRYEKPGEKLKQFSAELPFTFTGAQRRSLREIVADLRGKHPMSRLLHGDVGCGKTVVAVAAALYAAENNLQCAFMAPTEILAEQHYRNWSGRLKQVGVEAGLLTSSLKAAAKKKTAERCAAAETSILFGTHALIYDYVSFARLGLVVIDEQHRFGVEQRGKLYAKGDNPDLLVMTATPIPRTLALTLYGDLDISTIDTLPPGRQPVRTVWRTADVMDRIYDFVRQEVKNGGQAYVVFPLIERSEQSDLRNVEEAFEELSAGPFRGLRVAMVHGRIKPNERDRVLEQFRNGDVDILLSTTVIEVGLDNPNATIMLIEHAEHFGLAQLHQLRGRVGRGERPSTVVAVAHEPISEIGRRRLEYFASTTDGFEIAEADLKLRGPGEIFGLRQSGLPGFRSADLWRDRDLLEGSRSLLERIFTMRGSAPAEYRSLLEHLHARASKQQINLGGG